MAKPLPIEGLHHVALVTRRVDESIAFYRDVLGFCQLERPSFDFRGAWLYNYGVQIHLIENQNLAGGRSSCINTRANHLAFRVREMDSVRALLVDQSLTYREQVNAGGMHQIFLQDPDGHCIEISVAEDPSIGYSEDGQSHGCDQVGEKI